MVKIDDKTYYTTKEICEIVGRKNGAVTQYARKNNIMFIGEDTRHTYFWTENDLKNVKEYFEKCKVGRPISDEYKESDSLDTLYHRRLRYQKAGRTDLIEKIDKNIKKIRER